MFKAVFSLLFCLQHTRLTRVIYGVLWYDIPNKHRKLIVIMLQRSQKDLILSSALLNEKASRSLITNIIKQVYTLVNVLLKP